MSLIKSAFSSLGRTFSQRRGGLLRKKQYRPTRGLLAEPLEDRRMLAVLSISDLSLDEGDSGTTSFDFIVTLDEAADQEVTVDYTTADGTALAGSDYTAATGTLTFASGETSATFTVNVTGDMTVEVDEMFTVELSSPVGADISKGEGVAAIKNDDAALLSINDVSKLESNEDYVFTISLDHPADVQVDFDVITDLDVVAQFLLPGETELEITVNIPDNDIVEYDGEFDVAIGNLNASGRAVTLGDAMGLGTIFDDDTATLSINDVTQFEDENDGNYVFTISLSNPVDEFTTFVVSTDLDSTPFTLDPLETETTIEIAIGFNDIVEFDGEFFVTLSSVFAGDEFVQLPVDLDKAEGVGTILDDDFADVLITDVTMAEGEGGTTEFVFTVSLTNPVDDPVEVDFATLDGTATAADGDYQSASGTLHFDPLVTELTITVLVNGDTTVENDEAFTVELSNLVFDEFLGDAVLIVDSVGVGTIQNDDTFTIPPRISIDDVTVAEGHDGTTEFVFTVSLANPSDQQLDVDFSVNDLLATVADGDYVALSGTISFIPNSNSPTTQTITVIVNGDLRVEDDETFTVDLVVPDGVSSAKSSGVGTIENDDFPPPPSISILDVSLAEGHAGSTEFVFTVTLENPSDQQIDVDFTVNDLLATVADNDFLALSGTISFIPDSNSPTTQTITVVVNGDLRIENDETFTVDLSLPDGVDASRSSAIGSIENDDFVTPSVSIDDVSVAEGQIGTTELTFTVTLENAPTVPIEIGYVLAEGTATLADSDYQDLSGTLTFTPDTAGATSQTITVLAIGDVRIEDDETLSVLLSAPDGVELADGTGTGTILNDDINPPLLSINDVSLSEGDSGTTEFVFTVSLDAAVDHEVTVDFITVDDTAIAAADDYFVNSGTLTFAPGETTKMITAMVSGDLTVETDEQFTVELTSATGALIDDGSGEATILNDDSALLSIDDVTQIESEEDYVFTISLSNPTDIQIDFDVTTDLETVADFLLPGETEFQVTIFIPDNDIVEFDGEFDVFLENLLAPGRDITLGDAAGLGTILDDDTATLSIDDVTQFENENNGEYVFTISLSSPVDLDIFFDVTTDLDTTTLVMDPLVTETTITIVFDDNDIVEFDGFFEVILSNLDAAELPVTIDKSIGEGNILDDDFADILITDVAMIEGDDGTSEFVFTVSLTQPVDDPVEVDFATFDGTATAADGDYQPESGTLRFEPLVTSQTITVLVSGDTTVESDEIFTVELSNLVFDEFLGDAVLIVDSVGDASLLNDDSAEFSISDVSIAEGDEGTTTFEFTVTLSNPIEVPVTVDVNTSDGTATIADGDYNALSQTLTFSPGEPLSQTVSVTVNGDLAIENNERFEVALSNVLFPQAARSVGISATAGTAGGVIVNDDGSIMILDVALAEGESGTTDFEFRVILSEAMDVSVTVDYVLVHVTTDADDFNPDGDHLFTGSVTIAAGETEAIITIHGSGDTLVELDELFSVVISNARTDNGTVPITVDTGQGRMLNDDVAEISITDVALAEGDSGDTIYTLTVSLSSAVEVDVTVDVSTADGTATTADNDYQALANAAVTFTAGGSLSQTVTVIVNGDLRIEDDETFTATLSNVTSGDPSHGVSISSAQGEATLTILNDDQPTMSITGATVIEGDAAITILEFTVTLSEPSNVTVSATFDTADGTATTDDGDYVAAGGTVEFLAGETEKTVQVTINGDTKLEADETFSVVLSNPINAILDGVTDTATGTITNDDAVTLTIVDISQVETNSGTTDFVFTVTLSDAVQGGLTVDFATADGTATLADDYQSATGTLTFTGDALETQTITVSVVGDLAVEVDETFTLTLDNVITSGDASADLVTFVGDPATGTIENDDVADSSLAGSVYADTNNNGLFDTGEAGIPGVTITLTGTLDGGSAVQLTVMTADDGSYSFTDLGPGTYELTQTQPLAFADGIDAIGTPGGVSENDRFSQINLASGTDGADNNFGERGLLPTFVSKRLWLGSTPDVPATLRELNARAEELAGNLDSAASIREGTISSVASASDTTDNTSSQAAAALVVQVVASSGNVESTSNNRPELLSTPIVEPVEPPATTIVAPASVETPAIETPPVETPLAEPSSASTSFAPASIVVVAPPTLVPTTTTTTGLESASGGMFRDTVSPLVDLARDDLFGQIQRTFESDSSAETQRSSKSAETPVHFEAQTAGTLAEGATETGVTILSRDEEGPVDEELFDLLFGDEEFLDDEELLQWLLDAE